MGVAMPIYTVAILVFFIYTIVKIIFKNKKEEEEEEDEEFLNSEYYKKNFASQQQKQKQHLDKAKDSAKPAEPKNLNKASPEKEKDVSQPVDEQSVTVKREEKKTVSFNLKDTDSDPNDNHDESTMNDNDNSTDGDLKSDNDIVESEKEKEEKVPPQKGEALTSNNVSVKAAAAAEVDPSKTSTKLMMRDTCLFIASFRGYWDPAAAGQAGADREDAGESAGSDGRHQHAQPQTATQEEGELILFCTIILLYMADHAFKTYLIQFCAFISWHDLDIIKRHHYVL